MSQPPRMNRRLRKQLLRLEAESQRLEIATALSDLKQPVTALKLGGGLAAAMGGGVGLVATVAALVAGRKAGGLLRLLPIGLAAWRIVGLLRGRRGRDRG